jgi:hypothetical protein
MTPPAQPATAARTPKQAVTEQLLDASHVVAYREHRCSHAPSRPSPTSAKGHGKGRPESDTLNVSSSTSDPQPESRETTTPTVNDAPAPPALTMNGV